jgi:hypothetical protein
MGWMVVLLGLDSRRGLGIFLFTTAFRMALGPAQPPIQRVLGALSLGVKLSGSEGDHSLPSSAEVKECVELYLHSPNTLSWRGAVNFTFTFTGKAALRKLMSCNYHFTWKFKNLSMPEAKRNKLSEDVKKSPC